MKFSVDSFLADLHAANADASPRLAVREVVARAVSEPEALAQAFGPLTRGHSTALFRSPGLLVLHIVWPPEISVEPHEHNLWAVMGIYRGVEDNSFYRRTGSGIERAGTVRLEPGDTRILGEEAIHAVDVPTLARPARFTSTEATSSPPHGASSIRRAARNAPSTGRSPSAGSRR